MNLSTLKNKDMGCNGIPKGIPLNLNEEETIHTNPNGKEIEITKITDDMYFSKRILDKHSKPRGSSSFFNNHLEFNGWLAMNNFVEVDVEELEDKWS